MVKSGDLVRAIARNGKELEGIFINNESENDIYLRVNDSIRILKKDEYKIVLLNEKNAS
jgi:hypothetical protein